MKRDRLIIMLTILNVCASGARKTRVVYQANLNFKRTNLYIDILMREGLLRVEERGKEKVYLTTDQGKQVLMGYNGFCEKFEKILK